MRLNRLSSCCLALALTALTACPLNAAAPTPSAPEPPPPLLMNEEREGEKIEEPSEYWICLPFIGCF